MIPHAVPPHWPPLAASRFAAGILHNDVPSKSKPTWKQDLASCRIGLLGLADDLGVALNHGRTGAKEGPTAIRAAFAKYGAADSLAFAGAVSFSGSPSPPPPLTRIFDAGDVVPGSELPDTHKRVTDAVEAVLALNLFPIGLGGGHDLTYPFVRGVAKRFGALRGVYIDAHLDVRPELGSGMPFRKLIEENHASSLTCVGLDPFSNTREHVDWFHAHRGTLAAVPTSSEEAAALFGTAEPTFVSIDMDAIDQAYAPGVSAINPVGMTPTQVCMIARAAGASPHVICFDIMEFNPKHDHECRTARLAARLLLEFLVGFASRPAGAIA